LAAVRASAGALTEGAKSSGVPIILIGQVTKDGSTAGPKSLEHLVDVVLTLEGDRESHYRILRAEKNRFGSTDEVGVFIMNEKGLEEVKNPSEIFVRERSRLPGSCMTCVVEGSRALLVEVQALVHTSSFSTPVRRGSGLDINRLQMIIAVLTSRARLPLGKADVHVNIVGGIKLREPAADLAVALAIYSAARNIALPSDLCAFGEIGLGGELRSVRASDRRITESIRFGLKRVVCPPDAKTISEAINSI
jgi:DNA repair protein RadA/Sms